METETAIRTQIGDLVVQVIVLKGQLSAAQAENEALKAALADKGKSQ